MNNVNYTRYQQNTQFAENSSPFKFYPTAQASQFQDFTPSNSTTYGYAAPQAPKLIAPAFVGNNLHENFNNEARINT